MKDMIDLVFVRDGGFYTLACPMLAGQSAAEVAKDNAECNHGTLRVEDLQGKILWSKPSDWRKGT